MNSMTDASRGSFSAVGVGPGDPELLTLKAVRLLQEADVIYHAGPEPDRGRALETVRTLLRPAQARRIVLRTGMSDVKPTEWRRYYRAGVDEIAADCRAARKVVFITEGDPTLYSTAAYVWQLLAELHPDIGIEIVPGVSSVTAAAARVRWSLAQRDEPLLIVPGSYHADKLRAWLEEFPALCVMKPARTLPQIAATQRGRGRAVYIEEAGTPHEWITHDLEQAAGRKNYFSLVLLRREPPLAKAEASRREAEQKTRLHVVGIGPGDPALLTQQAMASLREAEVVIGYEGYLRHLAPLGLKAQLLGHPIGAETERARQALELAQSGRRVALISSGDAGVYGMASLLLETGESVPEVEVSIVPGITAALAASALLGAPLGHDFACISLSDLLTPWEVIAARLETAARGDFVIAIYNPVSQRRTWQLPEARSILRRHRRPETLVGLVDKAHRPGMRSWTTTLGELSADGIGMETILIVGNSQTRIVNGRMVTPRASGGRKPPVLPASGGDH
jgi:precorrin-2 C20-methyltransferase/precorrin-3B C17-methyltransferase